MDRIGLVDYFKKISIFKVQNFLKKSAKIYFVAQMKRKTPEEEEEEHDQVIESKLTGPQLNAVGVVELLRNLPNGPFRLFMSRVI
jgi:hypothetical protein